MMSQEDVPFEVVAVQAYEPQFTADLKISKGDKITVLYVEDDRWYYGRYVDKDGFTNSGIFPSSHVKVIEGKDGKSASDAADHVVVGCCGEVDPVLDIFVEVPKEHYDLTEGVDATTVVNENGPIITIHKFSQTPDSDKEKSIELEIRSSVKQKYYEFHEQFPRTISKINRNLKQIGSESGISVELENGEHSNPFQVSESTFMKDPTNDNDFDDNDYKKNELEPTVATTTDDPASKSVKRDIAGLAGNWDLIPPPNKNRAEVTKSENSMIQKFDALELDEDQIREIDARPPSDRPDEVQAPRPVRIPPLLFDGDVTFSEDEEYEEYEEDEDEDFDQVYELEEKTTEEHEIFYETTESFLESPLENDSLALEQAIKIPVIYSSSWTKFQHQSESVKYKINTETLDQIKHSGDKNYNFHNDTVQTDTSGYSFRETDQFISPTTISSYSDSSGASSNKSLASSLGSKMKFDSNDLWWINKEVPPSVIKSTKKFILEIEEREVEKRLGIIHIERDFYFLFDDFSQLIISVGFDKTNARDTVIFKEKSIPAKVNNELLEYYSEEIGEKIWERSQLLLNSFDSNFVKSLISSFKDHIVTPVGGNTFGICLVSYKAGTKLPLVDLGKIRPGDIVVVRSGVHTSTSSKKRSAGTKKTENGETRYAVAYEYNFYHNELAVIESNKSGRIVQTTYKLDTFKAGFCKVYRVVGRDYIGW
ncbi:hypothetical protein Kpol_538p25 [Vanderwaltozyma polyspora DSM 70294]|uniref:SH3 domain-containing protein n=1 Tax=Vanderwaltozyma polyspora (strain ATCC 22028 / DSM 70294 / BCRC 21397 / CBS 2163 / NBRC 10782 / NRRL Y-8283 / UCD 57-17) TaxID=436907 RepID=A7TKD8_VANPO|nr:uncharacterized protein Kpol_538p25 [Vanderwaltozyma polyspora DSM 70294]EDO17265.1 hypothetical protein Kpol_538p25 [Vanderwaltozyma polyspora DSM 70294]